MSNVIRSSDEETSIDLSKCWSIRTVVEVTTTSGNSGGLIVSGVLNLRVRVDHHSEEITFPLFFVTIKSFDTFTVNGAISEIRKLVEAREEEIHEQFEKGKP